MSERAAVLASFALSPFGRGEEAFDVTRPGEPARVAIVRDESLASRGFSRPLVALVPNRCLSESAPDAMTSDRATHLLYDALDGALERALRVRPSLRSERVGVAMGTSSGGMRSAERLFETIESGAVIPPELAKRATYFAPFADALHAHGLAPRRATQLVTACAASTWALGVGLLWLRAGIVDVAIAGGYDAHGPFVHAGFDALRATSPSMPAPFRVGREGMALGEGAGIVVMVRESDMRGARPAFFVSGFGASTDAVHITAPDRTGAGLARAATSALEDASVSPSKVAIVSAHATATPYNDAMEARAIQSSLPGESPVVMPFKAQIGHALGAAGVLETLALAATLESSVLPAAAGTGDIDDDARVRLLERSEASATPLDLALKQSAAFGGANAALVVESSRTTPRASAPPPPRSVFVRARATVEMADFSLISSVTGTPLDRVSRIDEISALAATSVARLIESSGVPIADLRAGAVIVGHALATIDINHRFYARVLAKGPTAAEPRLFPPTSPNLVSGQIAILFSIGGPSAAVCRGADGGVEALEIAHDLVAAGIVDVALAVAVDSLGRASREVAGHLGVELSNGATAVLLSSARTDIELTTDAFASAPGHGGLKSACQFVSGPV